MRKRDLFRIRHILAAIVFAVFAHGPAHALWLDVSGSSPPVIAPLVISPELPRPPTGDTRHGFFAMPPPSVNAAAPRLKMQYRADFPVSVTFETDGAVTVDREPAAGALHLTTRIIFAEKWWAPQVNASVGDVNLEGVAHGRLDAGQSGLRSEWKLRF
jgi:hypothetical protein